METASLKNISLSDFESIFKKYYEELCFYALKYLKNEADAEEAVQDVFFGIWQKRSIININISVKSYLYVSVRNKCLQKIQHDKIVKIYENYIDKNKKNENETPHEILIFKETKKIFDDILNSLPERRAEIFKLSRFKGLKYEKIAEKLNISIKTVEAEISKTLKELRIYFPEYNKK